MQEGEQGEDGNVWNDDAQATGNRSARLDAPLDSTRLVNTNLIPTSPYTTCAGFYTIRMDSNAGQISLIESRLCMNMYNWLQLFGNHS
jgi:hypothetical protein